MHKKEVIRLAFFDFLKGKKKEETKQVELKPEEGTIELEGIEVELPKAEENEIKLELSQSDITTAVNFLTWVSIVLASPK